MSDFDQERAVELVETLMSSLVSQKLIQWLRDNNKRIMLFEHDSMGIWVSSVLITGDGFLLHTRAGPNSHYVRDTELNRMLGIKPLTVEQLVFRAAQTGQWPNADSFRGYLRQLTNNPSKLQSAQARPV